MHTPKIKGINNNLWTHFEEVLRENWHTIYNEDKFHISYLDNDKEVILRFRVKDKENDKVILEVEKEISHITWELPVEKEEVEVIV
jgi:hypothetical protein